MMAPNDCGIQNPNPLQPSDVISIHNKCETFFVARGDTAAVAHTKACQLIKSMITNSGGNPN